MNDDVKHIIVISLDTLRADCIGASPRFKDYLKKYNVSNRLNTKCLDEIIKNGIYFNNCFSAAPYTSASHASYFTGVWPLKNNVYEFFNRKLESKTIFEYAKEKGYSTIFQTDFPIILGKYLGFDTGVDNYFIENEEIAFKTLLQQKNKTLSFFHFGGIHYPYGFHSLKFGGKDYLNKVVELEKKYEIDPHSFEKTKDVLDETFRKGLDRELLVRYKTIIEKLYQNKKYDDLFNFYIDGINYFFKNRFNKFIKKVKKFVDKNNAILVIFSDHGEEWDDYSYGHHNSLSDSVLRVPLIFYGNKIPKHIIVNNLVRTIDFAPTIVNLFSKNISEFGFDGNPLEIFNVKKIISNSRPFMLAQIWPAKVTKKQLYNFQQKTIKNKNIYKPLDSYLSSEIIGDLKFKLIEEYCQKNEKLEKITISRRDSSNKILLKDYNNFISILKKYNKSRQKSKKLNKIETKIKEELNDLGYKI